MITVERIGQEKANLIVEYVTRLLEELRDEPFELHLEKIMADWNASGDRFIAFVALDGDGAVAGITTVVESFAIYANGNYGTINEMYVAPQHRSRQVGRMLIDAVKEYAGEKGWHRIDVTAPAGDAWKRTVSFYEKQGFVFTGPKLKFRL